MLPINKLKIFEKWGKKKETEGEVKEYRKRNLKKREHQFKILPACCTVAETSVTMSSPARVESFP